MAKPFDVSQTLDRFEPQFTKISHIFVNGYIAITFLYNKLVLVGLRATTTLLVFRIFSAAGAENPKIGFRLQ
jgi:hypothetical protein